MNQVTQLFIYLAPLLFITIKVGVAIGGAGSMLEAIGTWRKLPKLVTLGQKLEAIGTDIPKLVGDVQKMLPPAALAVIACILCFALCACSAAQTKSEAQNAAIMGGCVAAEATAEGEAGAPAESADLASIKTGCATSLRVWDHAR